MNAVARRGYPIVHLVDDDPSVRKALTRLLRAAGFDAQGYASAEEFMTVDEHGAQGCVILDINMPLTGGLEVQRTLADRKCHLPVIFLSGYIDTRTSVHAMEAGAVALLNKPVDRDALIDAVTRALARHA
ncbi:MAG TPA: response regulator [Burkholderiales bacterium]|jgi:FixJ family two-component response regulator|nr:response regulator [Burkholderiales bacterium]